MSEPIFYLASTEHDALEEPRRCKAIKRLRAERRDDFLLVELAPPFPGQPFGLGDQDLAQVIVATRFQDGSLFPIKQWPVHVYVCRLLVPYDGQDAIRSDDLQCIYWGELYESESAARIKLR